MLFSLMVLIAQAEPVVPKAGEQPPMWTSLVPILLIFGVFYFLIILPNQRKERRQREELFSNLKKHDEVVTAGGIIGIVQTIKDDEIVLKIDDNARMRVLRSSITAIRSSKDSPPATDAPSDAIQKASGAK